MSRRDFVTVTGNAFVELDVTVDELIYQVGRDELLAALGEEPAVPGYSRPFEDLLADIDRELVVARDPSARLALTWVRDRITEAVGAPV